MTGSRDSEENLNKREDRQTISRTVILHSIHEHTKHNRRVTLDTLDGLEQKIDKLMVMMGKLVMKHDGQNSSNCEFIKPMEVEDKQDAITDSEVFKTDLGQMIAGAIHLEEA